MRALAKRMVAKILAGLPASMIWAKYQAARPGYLRDRLWEDLIAREDRLPEPLKSTFSAHKWQSEWFIWAWANKPLSLDHLEARHRAMRLIRGLVSADLEIAALDDLGTTNGTFLRDATLATPGLKEYRGWELSPAVVAGLAAKYPDDPRITFHRTDPAALAGAPGRSILVTAGTFQYFPEADLRAFLGLYAARPHATVVLAEISQFGLDPRGASTYRAHQAYNHDYRRILTEAGFEILSAETFSHKSDVPWVVVSARIS